MKPFFFQSEAAENPFGEDDSKSPFPVQPQVKRSYAQNVTVWIKASGLQVELDRLLKPLCLCWRFNKWANVSVSVVCFYGKLF